MPPSEQSVDRDWHHGMNGWRIKLASSWTLDGLPLSAQGEVTGFEHPNVFWVVFDGEEEPRRVYWHAVRPA